ncbi:lysophospholipid acyltransferase family protein [Novosphingobium sp. JCM 18896]|uniref:lysophospholipid acyltransferase family protein n=1 Tax=Novosphingobium sp. JCM 18896 TaxID=2989731 RepID=UPI002222C82A|nr:lysophospholipid acyltransferase family protein [Novosphingobium sp. JCM 18896]MCW1428015.1 1-acyl-sn-glycerol-3-phosphate acyltransferase [Novosphingobium sp. JCM 18896]
MLAWLGLCIVLYYLWRALRLANPWPRVFLGGIAWIAGVEVTLSGAQSQGRGGLRGVFLLANHVSWIDIPAIAGATGSAFVAHDGLAAIGPLRWLCDMNDTVFVARHDRASVGRQVEQVREAIRDTGALTIFPEGTTSDGTDLLPFKSSLLSALDPIPVGIAVQPIWLDYGKETADIAWIGEEPGLDNFLRILARARPVMLTLHFLPPLTGEALTNRKTLAAAARDAIVQAMGR